MDVRQLAAELKKGSLAPVYLISGEEGALVDRALKLLADRLLAGGQDTDFQYTRFDGKSGTAAEIEGATRTVSLFGGRRLVVLHDAQDLRSEEQKKLAKYLEHPAQSTTLVLVVRGGGPDSRDPKRAKAAKAAKGFKTALERGGGVAVDCPKPRARDLPGLVVQSLRENQLSIADEALQVLVDAVGEDLGALNQAVEKLSLFKGGPGEVLREDVTEVVGDTRTESVFALTDAVAEGAADRALGMLRRQVRDGQESLVLLGQLVRHFRNLGRIHALAARGNNPDQIRETLRLHPFVIKKCLGQSSRFSDAAFARCLGRMAKVDLRLKSSRMSEDLELERLVMALCRGG